MLAAFALGHLREEDVTPILLGKEKEEGWLPADGDDEPGAEASRPGAEASKPGAEATKAGADEKAPSKRGRKKARKADETDESETVSYTHLTLPTKRIV